MTGLFCDCLPWGLSHGANACVQTALEAGSGVLVQIALAAATVDNRNSSLVGGFCGILVTGIDCLNDLLHCGAHIRAGRGVVFTTLLCLAGAFSGLC